MYGLLASLFDKSSLACRLVGQRNGLRMAYYHRVNASEDSYYFNTGISPQDFEQQLDHFQKRYTIISLSEALELSASGQSLNGYLCISFDDGFRECYTHIFPALKRRNIKATFFLISSCLNNEHLMWRNKLLHIQSTLNTDEQEQLIRAEDKDPHMTKDLIQLSNGWKMNEKDSKADYLWEQAGLEPVTSFLAEKQPYMHDSEILEMIADGQEMGLHTKTHPFCDLLNDEELQSEIFEPLDLLNDRYHLDINALSYPFGRRCSKAHEEMILNQSKLQALLGIHDCLGNSNLAQNWERQGMEMSYAKSIAGFYLVPWKRR